MIYGEGAEDLETLKRQHKIQAFHAFDQNWNSTNAKLEAAGPLLVVASDIPYTAVSAVMNNGIWSKLNSGKWVGKGRDEYPDAQLSERTFKYAVHLRGPLKPVPKLKNQRLQIIPIGYQFTSLRGKKVRFKVLFEGQPAEQAKIIIDYVNDPDAQPLYTDEQGEITLPLRNQGLNVIAAIVDGPADNPKVIDKIEHLATLSFVLPHKAE
jgi:uncharacterized GH25 family protein